MRSLIFFLAVAAAPMAQSATTVTAIHATETRADSKSYDEASRPFQDLLDSLEYDRFETFAQKRVELATGSETRVSVNARYTLSFTKTEVQPDGHLKSTVRVFGVPRNSREPVEILEMTVRLAKDKPVMIRGLRMDEGEIVVFLNLD